MADRSTRYPLGTQMREVTFPDHSRGIILVRAGTSQDAAEEAAALMWSDRRKRVSFAASSVPAVRPPLPSSGVRGPSE